MSEAMSIEQAMTFCRTMAKGVSYRVPLKICAIIMASGIKKCFGDQASPDGVKWTPLKFSTLRARYYKRRSMRGKMLKGAMRNVGLSGTAKMISSRQRSSFVALFGGGQILRDKGILLGSVSSANAPGAVYRVGDTEAAVGTHIFYSAAHNFGYPPRNIPARPFVGHRPENLAKYDKIFADFEEKRFLKGK